jgi:hypothetical protein
VTSEDHKGAGATTIPALEFVAVLDPKGRAEETLRAILPDLAINGYHTHSTATLALAADGARRGVTIRQADEMEVILLGNLVGESVGSRDALLWAASAAAEGRYHELQKLQGVFVVVLVDWAAHRVVVVSDLLGVKPFYIGEWKEATILSDRAEATIRLGGTQIDPLGVAGWMYFGTPLVNRTLFNSVERISPATLMTLGEQGRELRQYWTPPIAEEPIDREELMEAVYEDFSRSLSRLLAPYRVATSLLSGGFDSRLCLLTALRQNEVRLDAMTVPYTDAERRLVDTLEQLTGVRCERVEVDGSIWDAFDSMWYRHPDGYPVTKNLTYLCVTRPDRWGPFIDGSISSVSLRCLTADPESGPPAHEAEARQFVWRAHAKANPNFCFRREAASRLESIAREAADEHSRYVGWSSKFCLRWDTYHDERRFTPVNFLQYADLAPSVQPFYDRAMIERRLRHPNKIFTKEFYHGMLRHHFPGPGGLPHSSELPKGKDITYAFSKRLWRELPSAIRFVNRHKALFNRSWVLPRITSYGFGHRQHMYIVKAIVRLMKLQEDLRDLGVEVDYRRLAP